MHLTTYSDHCQLVYYPYNPQRLDSLRSELRLVADLQSQNDYNEHGRRHHPTDLSMIASLSNPTISSLSNCSGESSAKGNSNKGTNVEGSTLLPRSDVPTAMSATKGHDTLELTSNNFALCQSKCLQDCRPVLSIPSERPETIHVAQLVVDPETCPASILVWLYSSANPLQGDHAPPIEGPSVEDSNHTGAEADDLETLRRVCIARSMPAARHYLDAAEYVGMDGQAVLYLRKILDSFPKAPPIIARRLAQRNLAWTRKMSQRSIEKQAEGDAKRRMKGKMTDEKTERLASLFTRKESLMKRLLDLRAKMGAPTTEAREEGAEGEEVEDVAFE